MKMYIVRMKYKVNKMTFDARPALVLAESEEQAIEKFKAGYGDHERHVTAKYKSSITCSEVVDGIYKL